jgi:hypothetical protein
MSEYLLFKARYLSVKQTCPAAARGFSLLSTPRASKSFRLVLAMSWRVSLFRLCFVSHAHFPPSVPLFSLAVPHKHDWVIVFKYRTVIMIRQNHDRFCQIVFLNIKCPSGGRWRNTDVTSAYHCRGRNITSTMHGGPCHVVERSCSRRHTAPPSSSSELAYGLRLTTPPSASASSSSSWVSVMAYGLRREWQGRLRSRGGAAVSRIQHRSCSGTLRCSPGSW